MKDKNYSTKRMTKKMAQYLSDCNVDGKGRLANGQRRPVRVPILKECCLLNNWNYDILMDHLRWQDDELNKMIKTLLHWKEIILERGMMTGVFKPGPAVFCLKQLGWKDGPDSRLRQTDPDEDDELTKALEEIAKTL